MPTNKTSKSQRNDTFPHRQSPSYSRSGQQNRHPFPQVAGAVSVQHWSIFLTSLTQLLQQRAQHPINPDLITAPLRTALDARQIMAVRSTTAISERKQILASLFSFLDAVKAVGFADHCWPYYRSLIYLAMQCGVAKRDDVCKLLTTLVDHSRTENAFMSLLCDVTCDAAKSRSYFFIEYCQHKLVNDFFEYDFSQSSWVMLLRTFARLHLFDTFNSLYRSVTQKTIRGLIDTDRSDLNHEKSYGVFVDAILSDGIYHKGMPRDRFAELLKTALDFHKTSHSNSPSVLVIKQRFSLVSAKIQSYMTHVLAQITTSHGSIGHHGHKDAFNRCVRLMLQLHCIDILCVGDHQIPDIILKMQAWPPFPLPLSERFELTQYLCMAFLEESRKTITACSASAPVVNCYYQAWAVHGVGLIRLILDHLLESDGSESSMSAYTEHVLFFASFSSNTYQLTDSGRWLAHFEQLIEPRLHRFPADFSGQISRLETADRARLLLMANHYFSHVKTLVDLIFGGSKYAALLRMPHFSHCADFTAALDAQESSHSAHLVIASAQQQPERVAVAQNDQASAAPNLERGSITHADSVISSATNTDTSIYPDLDLSGLGIFSSCAPPPGLGPQNTGSASSDSIYDFPHYHNGILYLHGDDISGLHR